MKQKSFKLNWLQEQFSRLRKLYSKEEYSNEELKKFLLAEYDKRKQPVGRLYTNTTQENTTKKLETYIDDFLSGDDILTGYNVLIKNQSKTKTIAIEALEYILNQRKIYKKRMQDSEKGSPQYIYNKVVQLTFKRMANAYYGISSMGESIFYNPAIQNSITTSGQDLISTAIYLMENLLANNEHFRDTEDIINFVTFICNDKYDILKYLDQDKIKTKDDVKKYILSITDGEVDEITFNKLFDKRDVNDLNKIYYKNQLLKLFENSYFRDRIKHIAETGEEDPEFRDLIVQITMFNKIAWDRFIRISSQKRRASLVTDTDSTFCYLGKIVKGTQAIINDASSENKLNICNFYIYLITEAMKRIFKTFTDNCNIPDTHSEIINIKNEFLYSRILTTRNKKNYAGWLMSELGKQIPGNDPGKHLDMKGLAIRKSTVAKSLRNDFQNLLVNDILTSEKIDILKIMKDYKSISDKVTKSIKEGKTEYLIPKSVDPYTKYKNPASVEQVKSTIIWNALEPDKSITPPDNVKLVKILANTVNHPEMIKLKEKYPDKYEVIEDTVFTKHDGELDLSKNGLTAISIPLDIDEIPDYIRPLVDYDLMINANVKNANILLESLGLQCVDDKQRKTNYKTNIVQWI